MRQAKWLRAAGVAVGALALAGCSAQSNGTSSVSADGNTLTIYMSAPAGYQSVPQEADLIDAEQLAFDQDAKQVSHFTLKMQLLTGSELSSHARAAINNTGAIAYIGELVPGDSEQTVGITNAQDLLQVSPTDSALELTQATPAVAKSPKYFYESLSQYGHTFARLVPNSGVEAQAIATEMHAKGLTTLYLADDGSDYGAAMTQALRADATKLGITLTTTLSSADAYFYGSPSPTAAAKAFMSAAQANPSATLFGPSALDSSLFTSALTTAPAHLYISTPGVMPADEPAAYTEFASAFSAKYGHQPSSQAAYGYEAVAAVIAMISRGGVHGNNRGTLVKAFHTITKRSSAIGTYSIDKAGDSTLTSFVFDQLKDGALTPSTSAQG